MESWVSIKGMTTLDKTLEFDLPLFQESNLFLALHSLECCMILLKLAVSQTSIHARSLPTSQILPSCFDIPPFCMCINVCTTWCHSPFTFVGCSKAPETLGNLSSEIHYSQCQLTLLQPRDQWFMRWQHHDWHDNTSDRRVLQASLMSLMTEPHGWMTTYTCIFYMLWRICKSTYVVEIDVCSTYSPTLS